MTTVTGDIAYDFSAEENANPWALADWDPETPTPFRPLNGMTAIIDSAALKSNFNSAGFLSYVEVTPEQASMEIKGEVVNPSSDFNATVGCGAVNSAGNGYILWVRGNIWRIYKVTAFVLSQLGDTVNIAYSALDRCALLYEFSAGTATLTAKLNDVAQTLVRTDSSDPYNGDLDATWFFNFDDANTNGFRSIAADGFAVGPQIVDVNGDDVIEIGSENNTLNTSDLDVGFLSVGTLPVTLDEITPDEHTFSQPWFTDFETYPLLGSVQALAATGGDPEEPGYQSATKSVTLQLPAAWNAIIYGALSDDPDSLASMIEGASIEAGDIHYYRPADITLYDDSTFSDAPTGTVETWLRKSTTNMMIQVLIINGVPVVPGGNWASIEFIEKIDFIG